MLQDRTRHDPYNRLPTCTNRAKRKTSASVSSHHRDILSKPKNQAIKTHPLERCYKQNRQQSNQKDTVLPNLPLPRYESNKHVTHEDTDSGSDISDTERLPHPALTTDPPVLHLRKEIIHPSDFQTSGAPSRSNAGDSYPDFLPPPYNCWNLQELAMYLNTDGKNVPRSRPVSQFEGYLDRILQLEWCQIQTLHDESSKSICPVRRKPHSSLSAPKSILQCQRSFAFTLLTSVRPQTCNRHSGSLCMYSHSLMEKKQTGTFRRSSSETRAHRSNRQSDSSLDHVKLMQAVGNIRNPATHGPHVNGPMRKSSGVRSHSCGDGSHDGYRRSRTERRTESHRVIDSKSVSETGSENRRIAAKQKRVEFVF
ncbi:hypothetical protein C0J50_17492 [Silurus asotus]|uniref:Family with sequence similarity 217 member B n=1 Tax=Silurus asotus TaxID=30991 RepID=A0AAD5AVW2_SILAS|nr:hypothetical protein C0J50_17492 [Silurus asotus]